MHIASKPIEIREIDSTCLSLFIKIYINLESVAVSYLTEPEPSNYSLFCLHRTENFNSRKL